MDSWLVVVILGIIEGITEFIPVSSTGHLLLAQQWLPAQSEVFNIVIQCGAALALIPLFWRQLKQLAFNLDDPKVRDFLFKLIVAFVITGVGGLLLKKAGLKLPSDPIPVAWAVFIGGIVMLLVERWIRHRPMTVDVSWFVAIAVGVAQLLAAVFPGASRSGTTIVLALALGLSRSRATEFSFLLGIPTLLAAGALELYGEVKKSGGSVQEDWSLLALGTIVSAVVSFIVVRWLIRFVQSHTFDGFAMYRILVGGLLLWYFWPVA